MWANLSRRRLAIASSGVSLLALSLLMTPVVQHSFMRPGALYGRTGELGVWVTVGTLCTLPGLILVAFGRGWPRLVLIAFGLLEMAYWVWISGAV